MSTFLLSILAVILAYLIGAVPFGFLVARWGKGIDIRTVGSGNIGATNVGRVLGFRYFWVVFAFDLAKGLMPTWWFPRLVAGLTGKPAPAGLAVVIALACILGHNYPVYLKFKGGKGVATSLGAMLALDPVASLAAAGGFAASLAVCRFVSLSSVVGGFVFAVVHFARVASPWSREQLAMSVLTIGLLALLTGRHRKNFARIAAGTEPKVGQGKDRSDSGQNVGPSGKIAVRWLLTLVALLGVSVVAVRFLSHSRRPATLAVGRTTLTEVARAETGHQRAERVAFADGGRLLVVTCPRYDRVLFYKVTDRDTLELQADVDVEGKPVAVCPASDRVYALMRPPGDRRHVEPGWWQAFGFDGKPRGGRVGVGFYPDDMALAADGKSAYVLTSGRAEGSSDRPEPALDIYALGDNPDAALSVGRVVFVGSKDDPSRITLSASGQSAAVTLSGSNEVANVDLFLFEPARPRLVGRTPLSDASYSYPSRTADDWILMPVASGSESALMSIAGIGDVVASTLPHGSGLSLINLANRRNLGTLTLHSGALGLSLTRPTGLAYSRERGLIAVANRSGGVHLVAVGREAERVASRTGR